MADVIDRDEFFRLVQEAYQKAAEKAGTHFKDIVQVVRCKDCKHFFKDDRRYVIVYRCELLHEDMRDYFFCADGERREDNGKTD